MKFFPKLQVFLVPFVFFAFFALFFLISLNRYYTLQLFHYDFGIFASVIWQLSYGKLAVIDHISLGNIVFLGDHFQPSLGLLAPLFWFTKDIRILLTEQALVIALSGFVLYLIALKKNLTKPIALIFSIIFLLFAGIENPIVSDWHPEPTAGLFLILFIYFFMYSKRRIVSVILALIFLNFKESNAITLSFFLVSCLFILPKRRKEILAYIGVSILWFFAAIKIFIPFFSHRPYFYSPEMPGNIAQIAESLGNSKKYQFVIQSFLSFGFLPLLAKYGLIPVIGEIAVRVLPLHSFFENYTLGMHYNVYLGIFLVLAAMDGFVFLTNKFDFKKNKPLIALVFLAFSIFIAKKITTSPIIIVSNPVFWKELHPRVEIFQSLKKVPETGSVASQNNLLPLFVLRKEAVFLINKGYRKKNPKIIVFDLSIGQNPNSFFPKDYNFFVNEKSLLEKSSLYDRIPTENNNIYVFVRK